MALFSEGGGGDSSPVGRNAAPVGEWLAFERPF
jgi:hypothetical protein